VKTRTKHLLQALFLAPLAALPASALYALALPLLSGDFAELQAGGFMVMFVGVSTVTLTIGYGATLTYLLAVYFILRYGEVESVWNYLASGALGGLFFGLSDPGLAIFATGVFFGLAISGPFWWLAVGRRPDATSNRG